MEWEPALQNGPARSWRGVPWQAGSLKFLIGGQKIVSVYGRTTLALNRCARLPPASEG